MPRLKSQTLYFMVQKKHFKSNGLCKGKIAGQNI